MKKTVLTKMSLPLAFFTFLLVFTLGSRSALAASKSASGYDVAITTDDGLQIHLYDPKATSGEAHVVGYVGDKAEVVIPEKVGNYTITDIFAEAFMGNTTVKSITIPGSIYNVKARAFKNCTSLENVILGDHNSYLVSNKKSSYPMAFDEDAFAGCTALKEITFPYGVTTYCKSIFAGAGITKATVYRTTWTNFQHVFDNCEYLEELVLISDSESQFTNSNSNIGREEFNNLPSLKTVNVYNAAYFSFSSAYYHNENGSFAEFFVNCPKLEEVNLYFTQTNSSGEYIFGHNGTKSAPFSASCSQNTLEGKNKTYILKSSNTDIIEIASTGTANTIKNNALKPGKAVLTMDTIPFVINVIVGNEDDNKINLENCKLTLPTSSYTYTGCEIVAYAYLTYEKEVLVPDTDYTISCKNNKEIGTATITFTGKGDYTGSVSATYEIIPTGTTLKIANMKTKTLMINTVNGVDGYQIYYSSKKSSGFKSLGKTTDGSLKSSKLKSGLYIRVRTYKKVGKTTYYSTWSVQQIK